MSSTTNVEGKKGKVSSLGSGASDHMVCELDWLCNVQKITPRSIVMRDGRRLGASQSGYPRLKTLVAYND